MNKDTFIGILVAVVVIGGGYLLLHNKKVEVVDNNNPPVGMGIEPSGGSSSTPPATPATSPASPVVVTSQTAVPSSSSVALTGTVRPNGASTTYWFEYGETTAFGNQSSAQAVGSGYSSISAPGYITGLKADTMYFYRLSAKNRFATVAGSTYTFKTNNTPAPTAHVAPTTHTNAATSIARTTANLNGMVDPNGFATNYWFEYGRDQELGLVTDLQAAGSGTIGRTVSVSLSGLDPLTTYYFRLNAQNQYGTINGAIMSFKTIGPATVSEPSADTSAATAVTKTSATLNGVINPHGASTTYWFEYSEDSLFGSIIGSGTPQKLVPIGTSDVKVSAGITGLAPHTTYFYRLMARNSEGSITGDSVSFQTKS